MQSFQIQPLLCLWVALAAASAVLLLDGPSPPFGCHALSTTNNHKMAVAFSKSTTVQKFKFGITETESEATSASPSPSFFWKRKWNSRYHLHHQQSSATLPSVIGKLPWLNDDSDGEIDNVYLSHWNWQLEYFQKHLTNLRVHNDQTTQDHEDLMYVQSASKRNSNQPSHRIYTLSLQSNEYRDIRMTYLHCGDQAQIFRCTCYPRNEMPILGMGLMQFGKGQRNVAIVDFQPLLKEEGEFEMESKNEALHYQARYTSCLQSIRSSYPSMQQPMSNRHFDPNERRYFTSHPIIGKWSNQDGDDENKAVRQDLQEVHQDCVRAHVELTRRRQKIIQSIRSSDEDIVKLHSDYDTYVSSKEPASQLLSATFGVEVANRLVHQVIFPLSKHDISKADN